MELRADLFNFANHTNFWLFNAADILSGLTPCGATPVVSSHPPLAAQVARVWTLPPAIT